MKSDSRLKIACIVMMIHNITLALWGLLLTFLPDRVFEVSSLSFLGRNWASIKQSDGRMVDYITSYARFWGLQGIVIGVLIIFLTLVPYRKGERWAWLCIAVGSTIGWLSAALLDARLGLLSIVYIDLIPLALAYFSLALAGTTIFAWNRAQVK